MSSPDLNLIAFFCDKERYAKHKGDVKTEALLLAETSSLLSDVEAYFTTFPSESSVNFDKFRTFTRVIRHKEWKVERHENYDVLITRIEEIVSKGVDIEAVAFFTRLRACNDIAKITDDVASGKTTDLSPIIEIVSSAEKATKVTKDISDLLGPTDLTAILDSRIRSAGIEWRLDAMNTAAGPLHAGDLVLLSARPEAGKTSWICSELTHMVNFIDADKNAVIFNPEEGGGKVFLRLITAATGQDLITVAANESAAKMAYEGAVARFDRIQIVEPAGGITTRDIERVLETGKFGLVAINVLDKIKPSFKLRDEGEVSRYRSLAYWMREAANRYSVPIIAVAQASEAAEGQRYLTQSMIYGSKTGVQGEIDLFLGMGYDPSVENRRWLSLLKNKLPGGPKTNPLMKHAKIEVQFDPSTGRYTDL
jgi:replicative DNA helicase